MKGLTKVAAGRLSHQQHIDAFVEKAQNNLLNNEELNGLISNLRNNYGAKAHHEITNHPTNSSYFNQDVLDDIRKQSFILIPAYPDGVVLSSPNKHLILHEFGHSLDPKLDRDVKLSQSLAKVAPSVGFLGGAVAPIAIERMDSDEESKKKNALMGAGAAIGAGTGLAYAAGKKIEGTEDRANNFVKKYLTDELGDKNKAIQSFDDSPLPHGRQTYKRQTKNLALGSLINGAVGGGIGLGVASLVNRHKNKGKENKDELKKSAAYTDYLKSDGTPLETGMDPVFDELSAEEAHNSALLEKAKEEQAKAEAKHIKLPTLSGLGVGTALGALSGGALGRFAGRNSSPLQRQTRTVTGALGGGLLGAPSGLLAGALYHDSTFNERHPEYSKERNGALNQWFDSADRLLEHTENNNYRVVDKDDFRKSAAYQNIENGTNIARRNEEYYDHTPESTGVGAGVGAATGVVSGGLAGHGFGRAGKQFKNLSENNTKFRIGANRGLANLGFEGVDVRDIANKIPKTKTATGIGLGLGLLGGAVGGAYKGMMTGVGMNDRQYLLERNIEPHELVDNSAMAALNMGGATLNPLSPIMNEAFGAQVGAIRRARYENTEDGSLQRR